MAQRNGLDGLIKVKNLFYSIEGTDVLKNINLSVPEGVITVIIGPSGSGKSTLLQILAGLLEPQNGKVIIKNTDLFSLSYEEKFNFRKNNLGIMFQELGLFDWLTVEENIAFPLRIHTTMSKGAIEKRVAQIISELRLKGSEKLYPDQLSGGMQRRVALGRMLALDPEILLLDEPTSGLDPVIAASVEETIKQINESKSKTFVIISHTIETTLNLADYIGVIFQGKLIQFGEKEKILSSNDAVVRQYFSRSTTGPITADR